MILGICGLQSSGKDTIGNYLIKNYQFKKFSFAEVLKDIISILFNWDRNKLEGLSVEDRIWRENIDEWWSKELNIPEFSPRYAMRFIGTDLFRTYFRDDIWVKILKKKITEISLYKNVVITDCRFPNEINMIKSSGGKIIHLYRNIPNWVFNYKSGTVDENHLKKLNIHISEYAWIKEHSDHIIFNSKSVEELYEDIDNFMKNQN